MADEQLVPREKSAIAFDRSIRPVLEVVPPATVVFETGDESYSRLAAGESIAELGLENFNVVTGPVFVRGAEPGDALRVDIVAVEVTRAWSAWIPGIGRFGDRTPDIQVREITLRGTEAIIADGLRVPIEPMIGCIGVAPAIGRGSTFRPAYPWGGNMDLRELSPGATLYLPVQVSGALLSLGDLHAAMGEGERTGVSLEAAGHATVRLSVDKGIHLTSPRVRVGVETMCLGLGADLPEAIEAAADQAFALLTDEFGLAPFDAYAYFSARVGMRLGGPASPMALAVVPDPRPRAG